MDAFDVQDDVPEDLELREVVMELRNGRSGGASKIRAEHIKGWLRGMLDKEKTPEGNEGKGGKWLAFVKLIQAIWKHGHIPQQMMWIIIVLIPKGGGGNHGIGLMEPFWKVVEKTMDRRLDVVEFHDCLHGFRAKRGTGTAIAEAKLAQQLAHIEQQPWYVVFLDLRKAYDSMDRDRCELILVAYGVGPNIVRLIRYFWDNAGLVCRAGT